MKRNIITTGDGSKTIQITEWNEQYHSVHGAVQEAEHVFIKHGLENFYNETVSILEIGFGTGLNALITLMHSNTLNLEIDYTGVEKFPVNETEITALDYVSTLNAAAYNDAYKLMHQKAWEEKHEIVSNFFLTKQEKDFLSIADIEKYNLVYFDAFGARVQPELWTEEVFKIMYNAIKPKGILVTYCAKGSVRRAMQAVGFTVERLPGPPGKREMLRATK